MPAERQTTHPLRQGRRAAQSAWLCLILSVPAAANPAFDYLLHCGGCHLENGAGAPPAVPDLREDLATFARLPEGRAYLVRVPGAAQAPIDDATLAQVLNWMLNSFCPDRSVEPFTATEVSRYRAEPLSDPLKTRREVLDGAMGGSGH